MGDGAVVAAAHPERIGSQRIGPQRIGPVPARTERIGRALAGPAPTIRSASAARAAPAARTVRGVELPERRHAVGVPARGGPDLGKAEGLGLLAGGGPVLLAGVVP
jgi:hypothetical protein